MALFGKPAIVAGEAGLMLAVRPAFTGIAPTTTGANWTAHLLRGVAAEAAHSTVTMLWIILPAGANYGLQKATVPIARIRGTLASLTNDRWLQAILVMWVFGLSIKGSAAASNILFTDLQVKPAANLAPPAPLFVAAPGFGAAIKHVVAPTNIIAGSAPVGLTG